MAHVGGDMRKILNFIGGLFLSLLVMGTTLVHAETVVVLLGTGTPNPKPDRMGAAIAIVVNGTAYIIDAGTGVVRRAQQAFIETGIQALDAENLGMVFLTHLHSDHTLGLADLILTPWVMGREAPLKIIGPPGVRSLASNLLEAYSEDIRIRVEGTQPQNTTGWQVDVNVVWPGFAFGDANVRVEAIRACHGEIINSYAYKFTTPDKVILISGDTTWCPAIEEAAMGVDILLHEAYSVKGFKTLGEQWALYHSTHHTSASDLAGLVNRAQPGQLILYHQISWGNVPPEQILDEIEALTDVPVSYGRDLDIYR